MPEPVMLADDAPDKEADSDLVNKARDCIQDAWDHDQDNRREAATDLAYLSGQQWPESVRQARRAADRPMLTINRLPQFVRQITNDIRQADLGIKVQPVDDESDPELAKIFDGLIRQIQQRSNAKHVFSTAAEHQASCGIGWFRVLTQYVDDTAFDQEIKIAVIRNPLSVYCDPGATEPDRSDAHWIAVTEFMPRKTFKRKYPKASEVGVETPGDMRSSFVWANDDAVTISEYWYKEPVTKTLALLANGETIDATDLSISSGVVVLQGLQGPQIMPVKKTRQVATHTVRMAIVSGSDVLEGPYEWPGKHIPLVPVIGGEFPVDTKTYRYGAIRFARDPQTLYNIYRSATAEAIALAPKAPYLATAKQIAPFKAMWDTAHTQNRPYLLYAPDAEAPGVKPQREHPPEMPAALMQEAQVASDDMKGTTGIYDAALGARSNETAGIAIRSRQAESDVANYHFVDNLHRAIEYAGRILIDLIPKVYDTERVIRLKLPEGNEEPVTINKQVMDVDGKTMVLNDLSSAAFDVQATIGRSYATKRAETADAMLDFMKTIPMAAPVLADLIAKALDFPDSDVIAKRLKNMVPPQALIDPDDPEAQPTPPPDPLADPMVRMELELKYAQARKTLADARKVEAETAGMVMPQPESQLPQPEQFAVPPPPPMMPGMMPGMPGDGEMSPDMPPDGAMPNFDGQVAPGPSLPPGMGESAMSNGAIQ
jgi:hypothetical protein